MTLAGEPVTLTIVGRAATHLTYVPDLITQPGPDAEELEFLISGDRPVTYPDAERLARHGFQTTSLHIVTHEPLPGTGLGFGIGDLAAAGGLIEVALLVGPRSRSAQPGSAAALRSPPPAGPPPDSCVGSPWGRRYCSARRRRSPGWLSAPVSRSRCGRS